MIENVGTARKLVRGLGYGLCIGLIGATCIASVAQASKEVDRIREKAEELASRIVSEEFAHLGEGKDSNLDRVYRDYDYLLKESKLAEIDADLTSASGEEKSQLMRLRQLLVSGMILAPVAASYDNAESYLASAAMGVADVELTLLSIDGMLANEEKRSNRRIWYLASRDLQENANVFELNLRLDLDKQANAVVETGYEQYLADSYQIDPAAVVALCESVLETTQSEYTKLLTKLAPETTEKELADLRQYDVPYMLRAHHLDETFKAKKELDVLGKWLKDLGLDPKKQKKLRIKLAAGEYTNQNIRAYPLKNGRDTRISGGMQGGFPDYWGMAHALGSADFFYQIDSKASFEDRRIGSPLQSMVGGALFQHVLTDPAWQAKYLKVKNAAALTRTVRFRELHDLRLAAAYYIFQTTLREKPETPATDYAIFMTESMGWTHGATEETNYLLCSDRHQSGLHVLSVLYAAELAKKLTAEHGEDWWSKGEAGTVLKAVWKTGYGPISPADIEASWGIGAPNPESVAMSN